MSKAPVFWFTGLSGAGKTTVASAVRDHLHAQGRRVLILDGDDVRKRLHVELTFSPKDIRTNNALIAQMCHEQRPQYDAIFVPIISPYRDSRALARDMLAPGFYEIHFCADLQVVMDRDVKGFYAKAQRNEIDNMIGFSPSAVYEPPQQPEFTLDSGAETAEQSIARFIHFVDGVIEGAKHV